MENMKLNEWKICLIRIHLHPHSFYQTIIYNIIIIIVITVIHMFIVYLLYFYDIFGSLQQLCHHRHAVFVDSERERAKAEHVILL